MEELSQSEETESAEMSVLKPKRKKWVILVVIGVTIVAIAILAGLYL